MSDQQKLSVFLADRGLDDRTMEAQGEVISGIGYADIRLIALDRAITAVSRAHPSPTVSHLHVELIDLAKQFLLFLKGEEPSV